MRSAHDHTKLHSIQSATELGVSQENEMTPEPDLEIIAEARQRMERYYVPGKHCVGAALRTESGKMFSGVHVEANCGRITVCAEAVALGNAATNGDTKVTQIVAVTESGDIYPPCGMCRELISDYAPEAFFIIQINDHVKCVPVSDLLPKPCAGMEFPNRR